jgi:4-amino-4-deoxy-L-arabinose transferase-like glycosyltransferase
MFIIGFHLPMSQRQYSWLTALLISGAFLSHPYVGRLGKQAMIDMPMVLFSIIAIYAIWRGTNPTLTTLDALRWGIISGLSGGMAISTKLNAILLLISCLLVGLINVYYSRSKQSVFLLLPVLFLLALVFFLLNPQLWSDIGAGIRMMIEHSNLIAERRDRFKEAALWTIGDKVGAFQNAVFGNPFNGILFLIGFYLLLKNLRQTYPLIVYGVINMVGIIVWTPLNWDRYYLPAVPFYAISFGYPVGKVLESTSILTAREDVSSSRKESSG